MGAPLFVYHFLPLCLSIYLYTDKLWKTPFVTTNSSLKLKKVGKTIRPFRYDLNQIPYDYTVEVRNRFKGLDLIDRGPDELWSEVRDVV